MMDVWTWRSFCSSYANSTDSNGALQIWLPEMQDFSECFHDLSQTVAYAVFLCGIILLILRSAAVRRRSRRYLYTSTQNSSLNWKLGSFAACGIFVTIFVRQTWLLADTALRIKLGMASHFHHASAILAWTAFLYLHIGKRSDSQHGFFLAQRMVQISLWFPVLAISVFELWSAIGGVFLGMPALYSVCCYILFAGQCLLLISFLGALAGGESVAGSAREVASLLPAPEMEAENDVSGIPTAYENSGLLSRTVIAWAGGLVKNGRYLKTADDLFHLPKNLQFLESGQVFRTKLAADRKVSRTFLVRILWSMWGGSWLLIGLLELLSVAANYTTPICLQKLVEFFETGDADPTDGYGWAAALIVASVVTSMLHTHCGLMNGKLSISVTGVLIDSIYRKLFCVYGADLSGPEISGKVVNLIGTDCGRINAVLVELHEFWILPLEIVIALYLLYLQVGVAFLGGIGVMLVMLGMNQLLAKRIMHYEEGKQAASDARVKIVQDILNCIRVIKFHAWEDFFQQRVDAVREKELRFLRGTNLCGAMMESICQTIPLGLAVMTFLIYVLMGNTLTAAKVFTSIALFHMLTVPILQIAWTLLGTIEMWVSLKRVQQFFRLPDLVPSQLYSTLNLSDASEIRCEAAEFSAQTSEEVHSDADTVKFMHDITLDMAAGEFIGITGRIGSGKTVLLNSILGELHKTSGDLFIKDSLLRSGFGYAPQEPWILQGTVRENILFGAEDIDLTRYQQVLECCALTTDLENLSNGDATEIGERGVTLSGGQKARLSLARAVYQDKPVIFLDDPLAAVDPHVAATIYTKCFLGMLRPKLRVLVTHNVECLRECDRVIVLKDGAITAMGTPDEVLSLPDLDEVVRPTTVGRQTSVRSVKSDGGGPDGEEEEKEVAPLVDVEESRSGTVKWSVYVALFRAIGWPAVVSIFLFAVLGQVGVNACDVWLSYWIGHTPSSNSTNGTDDDSRFFLTVYGSIAGGAAVFSIFWPMILFLSYLAAARTFHRLLLNAVLKAKMHFFDSTPSGRILNRFSKDVNSSDDTLPLFCLLLLAELLGVIGTLVVIIYSMPSFAAIVAPVAVVFYFIQAYYRHAARELKRLNSTTLSPLYSLYAETIQGLTTIRSMRASDRFCQRFSRLLVAQQRVQFATLGAQVWLELRLELLGILLICGVLLVGFLATEHSAAVGLSLSYSLSVVSALISLITSFILFEKAMVNLERIKQYIDDVEPEIFDGPLTTTPDWPETGRIDIDNLCVRYREDLPDVLNNVQLHIRAGEKVGIVGRTGAGKSSLMLALFRIVEAASGTITIDDVKISLVNLKHLRSRLTIIPQTASLFDASIRDNLDPLQRYSDEQVWSAVDKCHLKPLIEKIGGDLSCQVGDNGKNLSAGEKQLISLARAHLSNSKIICLDEATANIDFETDVLVQQTIRECLGESTILTIAHRVQTVMDCDRVIVMSNGRICEEGRPGDLMQQADSRFFQLVQQSKSIGEVR
ncbi:Multidrug resistance-associated protein 7 [Hypsibius exemplaris]|uniref:ABC-type xenobiotic transporter n=1 Tax=Hypsibius exemplaris TaxID=2072580 RepID=A0A9X6NJR6_HYPEX|nr:Multidrug resistance-associated protein 7 [Hypsibius exemplaris]